jgi:hypothetical protein
MAVNVYNLSTQEAKVGRSELMQCGLRGKTLSQNKKREI